MPAFTARAPGKIILVGEHAVVYGQPAIAVPIFSVYAQATIIPDFSGKPGEIHISAPDIDLEASLSDLPSTHPIAVAFTLLKEHTRITAYPPCHLRITSTIPVASGMGSGAAVSAAIFRAISGFLGVTLSRDTLNQLTYEIEKIHHGTPSGIDNTVVTHEKPVYYVKGKAVETFHILHPFTLVIADTGISSPTSLTVGDVRKAWLENPAEYNQIFQQIGNIVREARQAIDSGDWQNLGRLFTKNHQLLKEIKVSCEPLDALVTTALASGALGAKLSGGGRGGNMIALVEPDNSEQVSKALLEAGAKRVIISTVKTTTSRGVE